MVPAKLIEKDGTVGVQFQFDGKYATVTFATSGQATGHIKIASGNQILIDKALTTQVTPQASFPEPAASGQADPNQAVAPKPTVSKQK